MQKRKELTKHGRSYMTPPIPNGYKHVLGTWNNGYVIERTSDGSQFVWIPVGSLKPNGILSGKNLKSRFGRRHYIRIGENNLNLDLYHEPYTNDFKDQIASVKKYGGFYISRFNISRDAKGGIHSLKNEFPLTLLSFNEALQISKDFEKLSKQDFIKLLDYDLRDLFESNIFGIKSNISGIKSNTSGIESNTSGIVTSHLIFGAEYDSVIEWLLESRAKSRYEIIEDSSRWGNYWNSHLSIAKTGYRERFRVNNIYDLAGNVRELTQERYSMSSYFVVRGGDCHCFGSNLPAASRYYMRSKSEEAVGFRIALCIR